MAISPCEPQCTIQACAQLPAQADLARAGTCAPSVCVGGPLLLWLLVPCEENGVRRSAALRGACRVRRVDETYPPVPAPRSRTAYDRLEVTALLVPVGIKKHRQASPDVLICAVLDGKFVASRSWAARIPFQTASTAKIALLTHVDRERGPVQACGSSGRRGSARRYRSVRRFPGGSLRVGGCAKRTDCGQQSRYERHTRGKLSPAQ